MVTAHTEAAEESAMIKEESMASLSHNGATVCSCGRLADGKTSRYAPESLYTTPHCSTARLGPHTFLSLRLLQPHQVSVNMLLVGMRLCAHGQHTVD